MSDSVFLHQISLECHIGVTDTERANAQEVIVDVDLETDLSPSGATDDVDDTVDYRSAWETVRDRIAGQEFKLVEALAEQVAADLLARFPSVSGVTVQAVKPRAMADRKVGRAGVRITRQRA